nr:unnamed protein product [Callosobruchus chinensis]
MSETKRKTLFLIIYLEKMVISGVIHRPHVILAKYQQGMWFISDLVQLAQLKSLPSLSIYFPYSLTMTYCQTY